MKAVLSQFIPQLYRTRRGANPKETIDVHEQFGTYLQDQDEYEVLTPGCTWF